MRFVALLRGINVGGTHRVEMPRLRALFESLGCRKVETYINSGNVLFEADVTTTAVERTLAERIEKEFGFAVPILVKPRREIRRIADAVPETWRNDKEQKTDVAYLFPAIDSSDVINALPVKKEFIDLRYTRGALYWNVERKNLGKSNLNKIVTHRLYKLMTIRNVNTCRYLAGR